MVVSRNEQGRRPLLIVPIVAALVVIAFLFLITSTVAPASVETAASPDLAAPTTRAADKAPLPDDGAAERVDRQPVPPAEAGVPAPQPAEPLAIVNGTTLSPRDLEEAIAIDAVMAAMAGQSPTSPALLLEQLVNTRLVLQAAGDNIPAIDTAARLASLLAASGRDLAALDQALAASSIDRERFDLYFAQLVAADALARAHQAGSSQAPDAYVRELQRQARISFSGDGSALLAANVVEPTSQPAAPAPDIEAIGVKANDVEKIVADAPAVNEARGTEVGQIAPQFSLPALDGAQGDLALESLRGQPLVLSFWTTWCPYCLRQTPVLVDAYGEWSARGIQFVGINVQEERGAVEPYVSEHGIAYSILLDAAGETAQAYAIQGYPTTYFLDADNRIVARHVGALTAEQLTGYLQNLLPPTQGP